MIWDMTLDTRFWLSTSACSIIHLVCHGRRQWCHPSSPWTYNGKEFVEMHGLDEYDFEMHSGYSLSTMIRNTLTIIGGMLAGKGTPYQINVYGNQHVRSTLP